MGSKEAIGLVKECNGAVGVLLRTIVVGLAAGHQHLHGGVLVAHPVVGQPRVNATNHTQNISCIRVI